ncbi:hypothetical protein [Sporocytophaga myxococcoides]|uniref:hypothetical protein n=1 Tax=Sporocytophaga myxococcoides TaxID=153721 RepID=UPI00040E68DF|nr:hypothetical protein [Sporocytophaga myxococcoides]
MKTTIYFLLFILLINKSFSQDYIPTIKTGRIWEVFYPHGLGNSSIDKYQIRCDTTINNTTYKKVSYLNNVYIGAVREDIDNKKVYFFRKDATQERLVADYSLAVGELFYDGLIAKDLDSIKVQYIHGANRRVFYFDPLTILIEGEGSNFSGIINNRNYVSINNLTDNVYTCDISSTKSEEPKPSINIFPNPTTYSDFIYINGLPINKEVNYQIYSLTGQMLKEGLTKNLCIEIKDISEQSVMLKLIEGNSSIYNKILLINR